VRTVSYSLAQSKEFPLTAASSARQRKEKSMSVRTKMAIGRSIEVSHLARPSTLTPAQTNYVVWIQARGREPENKGQLAVNDKLEGKLETTTPYEAFEIFVTAEGNHVSAPEGLEFTRHCQTLN
jgi:hypothetical protein